MNRGAAGGSGTQLVVTQCLTLGLVLGLVVWIWFEKYARSWGDAGFHTGDLFNYYYPLYLELAERLRAGELPLWNPRQLCGTPILATLQAGNFYPPHLLFALLPTHLALACITVGHLCLVACATFFFTRRLGVGVPGAAAASLLAALGIAVPSQTFLPNTLEVSAWFPVGCVFCWDLLDAPRARAVALLALAYGMSLLAGYPQLSLYLAYGWAGVLALLLAHRRRGLADWLGATLGLAAAGLLGAVLAAAQLVPAAELYRNSGRGDGPLSSSRMYPFGVPESVGEAFDQVVVGTPGVTALLFGFGGVGLALLPVAFLPRCTRRAAGGLCALGIAWLVLALGPVTPLFDMLVSLPGIAWFRLPIRGLFIAGFCFAVLVGIAVHAAPKLGERWLQCGRTSRAALRLLPVGLAALVAIELALAAPNRLELPYWSEAIDVYHDASPVGAVLADRQSRVWLREGLSAPILPPKLPSQAGWRALGGYEPINTRRQSEYFDYLERGQLDRTPDEAPFTGSVAGNLVSKRVRRMLDLSATRYVVIPLDAARKLGRSVERAGYRRLRVVWTKRGTVVVLENPTALPRAYITYAARSASAAESVLAKLTEPAFDPRAVSYVEGDVAGLLPPNAPAGLRPGTAHIVTDDSTRIEIEARLEGPGLLVLADAFYPGWRASVDGEPRQILPTNHLFRGVVLEAGRHTVALESQPRTLAVGAAGSLVGVALIAGLAIASGPGRRGRALPLRARLRGGRESLRPHDPHHGSPLG